MCNDPAEVLVTWCCLCAPVSAHTTTTSSSSSSSSLSCLIWTVWAGESVPQSERVHLLSGARVSWQRLGPVRCFFTLKKKKKKLDAGPASQRRVCARARQRLSVQVSLPPLPRREARDLPQPGNLGYRRAHTWTICRRVDSSRRRWLLSHCKRLTSVRCMLTVRSRRWSAPGCSLVTSLSGRVFSSFRAETRHPLQGARRSETCSRGSAIARRGIEGVPACTGDGPPGQGRAGCTARLIDYLIRLN